MPFDIFPAIDLRGGRVVRLQLGDPDRQTVFSDAPLDVGRRWHDAGAGWLHVVNLDGAFAEGGRENWAALEKLLTVGSRIQFGGGLRSMTDIETALALGVDRVVLGTAALETPALVGETLGHFGPERIVAGIDARDGRVRIRGWRSDTGIAPLELARQMSAMGVRTAVYTDISRDGILSGVNVAATADLAEASGLAVIASGGVHSLDDVAQLRRTAARGVAGVIIGRALYEGQVDLAAAVALAAGGQPC